METYSKCGLGVNPVSWKKHFSYPFIHIEVQYLLLWIFLSKNPCRNYPYGILPRHPTANTYSCTWTHNYPTLSAATVSSILNQVIEMSTSILYGQLGVRYLPYGLYLHQQQTRESEERPEERTESFSSFKRHSEKSPCLLPARPRSISRKDHGRKQYNSQLEV